MSIITKPIKCKHGIELAYWPYSNCVMCALDAFNQGTKRAG